MSFLTNLSHTQIKKISPLLANPSKATKLRIGFLGLILLILLILKASFNPYPVGEFSIDGSYYYQVARNVAEGNGFLTNVSLYHQGIKDLPQPSPIYPLWPLLLGATGALIGIDLAATLLPEILFFCSLFLLYFLANAMVEAWDPSAKFLFKHQPWVDIGHWAVLLLGLNKVFFSFTSLPYTEGLAFTFAFGALLVLTQLAKGPSLLWGGLTGILASLAYLTRTQMIGVTIAIPTVLFLVSLKDRSYKYTTLASVLTIGIPIFCWITYLRTYTRHFTPRVLMDFSSYHETPELLPWQYLVETNGAWDLITDRLHGFLVAFDFSSQYSYINSFGLSAYIPLLALVWVLPHTKQLFNNVWSFVSPRALPGLSAILASLLCLLPIHAFHAQAFSPYLFQWRHGLPIVLLIVMAAGYLLRYEKTRIRKLTLVLMTLSICTNVLAIDGTFKHELLFQGPSKSDQEFARWISKQSPPPIFLTTRPWQWGANTKGLFHWTACEEPREQMLAYFQYVHVDHVVFPNKDQDCTAFTGISDYLTPVRQFKDESKEFTVWKVKEGNHPRDFISQRLNSKTSKKRKNIS